MSFRKHADKFPREIRSYFESVWDREHLWSLQLPVHQGSVCEFSWLLDLPFWSSVPPQPLFDLAPRVVLENPSAHHEHWQRAERADTSHAILVACFGGRLVVLDGLHRLVKLTRSEMHTVRYSVVPPCFLQTSTNRS